MPLSHLSFAQKSLRLSPMYFLYFTLFGVFVPYVARFLTEQGLTPAEASIVVAVVNGVNLFAPFLFSSMADRSGQRMIFIRIGYAALTVFYAATLLMDGFWFYLVAFGLFGVFLSAVLPLMESVTLGVLGDEKGRYGQVRMWGSLGFVVVVWLMGILLDTFSVEIIIYVGTGIGVLLVLSSFLVPEKKNQVDDAPTQSQGEEDSKPVEWGQVIVLLTVVLFWQFSMAPYNTFFDLYLREFGYSAATNGFLIAFGALCEIVIFIYIAKLFMKLSEKTLMLIGLSATLVRWLLLAEFPESFYIVLFTQSLHAFTFGIVHAVVIHRIGHLFPQNRASFGQGLYAALGAGFGLFVGNLMAGWLWDGSGVIYLVGSGWVVLALIVTLFGFKKSPSESA